MLLVSFHGGTASKSINNVNAYEDSGNLLTATALQGGPKLDELRAMVVANGLLYLANGSKSSSSVLCYQQQGNAASFTYRSTIIASQLDNGKFGTSIAHP